MQIMEQMKELWAKVLSLELDEIDDDANFFELGGDSVRGIQIVGEATTLNINLDLQTLMTHPRLDELSNFLSQDLNSGFETKKSSVASVDSGYSSRGSENEIFMSNTFKAALTRPSQSYFVDLHKIGYVGPSNYIYEVEGSNPKDVLKSAIKLLEARSPMLRTAVVQNGPKYLQVFPAGNESSFIETDSLENYLSQTASQQMQFGTPGFQYCLVKEKDKSIFIVSVYHAFFDGFSRMLFERDLLQALKTPSAFALEPMRPWFGDFATHLDSQGMGGSQYWQHYLEGVVVENVHPGVSTWGDADGILRKTLKMPKMVPSNVTSSTIIAAAWALALANHSGFKDVLFGLIKSGRSYPYDGIERILGLLTTITLFRVKVGETQTIDSFLQNIQHEMLASARYEHDDPIEDPHVQSMLNIKSGLKPMQPTTFDDHEKDGLSKIMPRRDLENWEFGNKNLCTVDLEAVLDGDQISFRLQYMSLLDHARAKTLFEGFWTVFNNLWLSDVASVGELLKLK